MSSGRIALDRGFYNCPDNHPAFKNEPFTEREAWVWMLGEAAFEACERRVGRTKFRLERGQFAAATRFMAARWQWSEARVRRFLERLKTKERMIDARADADATVITVCNYDDYQFGRRAADAPSDALPTRSRREREEPEEVKKVDGGDVRAREAPPAKKLISDEAQAFAAELARIAGHDPEFLPPRWVGDGPAYRVQMYLNSGWSIEVMRENAQAAMRRKTDGPPATVKYFEKIFARAHAPQLPLPAAQVVRSTSENVHEGPWRNRGTGGFAAFAANRAKSAGGS